MNPFLTCEKHGLQTYEHVCGHVKQALNRGEFPKMNFVRDLPSAWVCDDCQSRHATRVRYGEIKSSAFCMECLKTVEMLVLRSQCKPVPFDVFENTLTYLEKDKVDELEKLLHDTYDFPKVRVIGIEVSTLRVSYGAVTYPLSINIYGVIDRTMQTRILKTINEFFQNGIPWQRKVSFYREMFVEEEGDTTRRIPGLDKLLFEEIIK